MERPDNSAAASRLAPDHASALFALDAAAGLLALAHNHMQRGEFKSSLVESRNAIRMASSALLFRDGIVADSLDTALQYLLRKYPGLLPLEGWQRLESLPDEDAPRLYNLLLSAMGRLKKTGEQEAKEALGIAELFIGSARAEMGS